MSKKKRNPAKNPSKKDCVATMNTIEKLKEKKANLKTDCEKHGSETECNEIAKLSYDSKIADKKKALSGCPKSIKKRKN